MKNKQRILLLFVFGMVVSAFSALKPAPLFGDNAILQQGLPVPVWGTDTPGSTVTVSFAHQEKSVTADVDGHWEIRLAPMAASTKPRILKISSSSGNSAEFKNILIGEVWLASGQSNMAFSMKMFAKRNAVAGKIKADLMAAKLPEIRLVKVSLQAYDGQVERANNGWSQCSPETADGFSATSFYFARALHRDRKVPVGIILCAWSGSAIQTWLPKEAFLADPALNEIMSQYRTQYARFTPAEYEAEYRRIAELNRLYDAKIRNNIPRGERGPRPKYPLGPKCQTRPAAHYDVMLKKQVPYAIKGVIWYQGETDANNFDFSKGGPSLYRNQFSAMIRGWRKDWNSDLPFLFVQLPNWKGKLLDGNEAYQGWAELRDSQMNVFRSLPKMGMAVTIGLGVTEDIHPSQKEAVGERLALCAEKVAYGTEERYASGPVALSHREEGNKIAISFCFCEGDLVLNHSTNEFLICGADKLFVPAQTSLQGSELMVWSDLIAEPVAVRYAWENNAHPVLFDSRGLPASPFRTDSFKLTSQN
ncbi:sialate O-acetylesterase [Pontiella sulfatireligans]|uniref:Sialate O-acetylesterase domain-containing protein n=1 Tax=Pontiella sulfatireligans TaxID=2750658 RepID=A0A6C2URN3_9BACT|nr:sialate O-acetylesterase [Pontiella sulfatireligans]VGO21887.1 hypothetical protein SCARR_03967 [Pontiella sulfatireligans]